MNALDIDVRDTIYYLGEHADENMQDIFQVKEAIKQLYEEVNVIKSKAAHSEKVVHELTKDIKGLDLAKQNLSTTISALKRIQMLGIII